MLISIDPSTGEEIGRVLLMDASEVAAAVARARAAQTAWAKLSYEDRARFILRARKIVLDQIDDIAELISRETGKPVTEAIAMGRSYMGRNAEITMLHQPIIGLCSVTD